MPRLFVIWISLACLLGPAAHAAKPDTLRMGSKRFTESYILGEILTQAAASHANTRHLPGLGNTAIVFEALKAGNIDAYPDYTGTLASEILKLPGRATLQQINAALAPMGLGAAIPLGFENTYAIAVSDARAGNLRTLADLAHQPGLRLGLSHEFIGRVDGWPALVRAYGLPQKPVGIDHGLAYEALHDGQIDGTDIYSTDAKIHKFHLRVLEDNQHVFPGYEAVVVYRLDVPRRFPAAWQAMQQLAGRITVTDMIDMNAEAELGGKSFAAIARRFLAGRPATTAAAVDGSNGGQRLFAVLGSAETWRLTLRHLALVGGAVGAATLVGVPLGIVAARRRRLGQVLLALVGMLQTVPSLALLAMLIPLLGRIGVWPAMIALFMYALLPIVRNACTGLQEISQGMRDAARALGFRPAQVLRYVEIPLAMPVVLAGVKTAAIISVGTATIAAFVGAGGYGERIVTGLALNDSTLLLAGAIPAAVLALLVQGAFGGVEWWTRRRPS
ncbi:glycine betaine ABC transporter substrate-binding protein [Cupriavidus sp. EM10]|uniref:glycine betaine ABC transporter substrate-binding protein n=2 Tax=unclassified Cupriavidus TaxID=2640874 RepID=UPI001C00813B|nr:ABC transporter permease subunit [Cupriavidus sp.]QWE95994.1 ABC transporter permease subunit [Cupriavidus sp. EM10]MCA3195723.1 ABC transporter permease subunit [Cupriavidus sp.]MCA3203880.1 ABC transporter permease subunit [Cupriavidus sp.]MCA3206159.1 ABC transporter permease subunit [Cupriavidus sp.]